MVREKIQPGKALFFHIQEGKAKQCADNSAVPLCFFHIYGADVRRKVFSIVKIVFDNAKSAYDGNSRHGQVPLRNGGRFCQIGLHAGKVSVQRNVPFIMKPLRSLRFEVRRIDKADSVAASFGK